MELSVYDYLLNKGNMVKKSRNTGLDTLLNLNGQIFFISEELGLRVKFVAHEVPATKKKPHGIDYSLTMHEAKGTRILGFDNAHPIKSKSKKLGSNDHEHTKTRVKHYEYKDAETLVEDFWKAVDKELESRGV